MYHYLVCTTIPHNNSLSMPIYSTVSIDLILQSNSSVILSTVMVTTWPNIPVMWYKTSYLTLAQQILRIVILKFRFLLWIYCIFYKSQPDKAYSRYTRTICSLIIMTFLFCAAKISCKLSNICYVYDSEGQLGIALFVKACKYYCIF